MPKANNTSTTARRSRCSKSLSIEEMAAVSFEAVPAAELTPQPTLAGFMESAGNTFNIVRLGFPMLTKVPSELTDMFRALGDDAVLELLASIKDTKTWVSGVAGFLDTIETRVLIAGSRLAVEG